MKITMESCVDMVAKTMSKNSAHSSSKSAGQPVAFASLLAKAGVSQEISVRPENVATLAQLALLRSSLAFMEQVEKTDDSEVKDRLSTATSLSEYGGKMVTDSSVATENAQQTADLSLQDKNMGDIISSAGRRYALHPSLIAAVIKTESGFNSRAVSPAGAEGLMQLMPATARSLGVSNTFDPEENIMAGSRYLARLLDKYDGDLDKALAAYNWGEGNVDRKGLERLPLETKKYLAKVKNYYEEGTAGILRTLA